MVDFTRFYGTNSGEQVGRITAKEPASATRSSIIVWCLTIVITLIGTNIFAFYPQLVIFHCMRCI